MSRYLSDELVFCGVLLTLALIGLMVYDVIIAGHSFDPLTFGTGAASLLGGHGGAQMLRDRWSTTPDADTTPNAEK